MAVRRPADAALSRSRRGLTDLSPRIAAPVAALTAVLALALSAAAHGPGPAGAGDPFFPRAGNGGYNVRSYDLRLAYAPKSGVLYGRALIRARSKRRLAGFHLDLRRFRITGLAVNDAPARFHRDGQELVIRPRHSLAGHKVFTVRVSYRGRPRALHSAGGGREGWIKTRDGALVVAEPQGAPTWFPCNDHPKDKASFRFTLTTPRRLHAVANGRLRSVRRRGARRTWVWRERGPMAPYLATVNIGRGAVRKSRAGGVPTWTTVDPAFADSSRRVLARLPRVMAFLNRHFGQYPFRSAGAIVDRANIGYALETQTRPIFDGPPGMSTFVHEFAHQWFGNSVTLRAWPQIWLHEGFATWVELFWQERTGGPSARAVFRRLYRIPASNRRFWNPPPGRPGRPAKLFDGAIYVRGAMALQALRQKVGHATFMGILRTWARIRRHRNATIRGFIALSERRSGMNLDRLFRRWLFQRGKPRWGRQDRSAPAAQTSTGARVSARIHRQPHLDPSLLHPRFERRLR